MSPGVGGRPADGSNDVAAVRVAPTVAMDAGGVMSVRGELTFSTVEALRGPGVEALAEHDDATVDLAAVDRADSAGLALLVEWLRAARRRGARVRFANAPAQLRAIAGTSGLDRHIFQG